MEEMIACRCAHRRPARRRCRDRARHGGCFSAGADLKDSRRWANAAQPLDQQRDTAALGYRMARAWEELPQITLAAIEGYAIGGGLALAAALDWRVIAKDAFVSLPEISLGIPLTWGTLPRLVNLVGPAKAKRLTILCERVPAAEALAMGLADFVSPPGKAFKAACDLAAQVRALPRNSVRMSKRIDQRLRQHRRARGEPHGARSGATGGGEPGGEGGARGVRAAARAQKLRSGSAQTPLRHEAGRAARADEGASTPSPGAQARRSPQNSSGRRSALPGRHTGFLK